MKEAIQKSVKTILCIGLTVAVYLYLCMVLTPKDIGDSGGSLYYRGMGFLAEPENSIQVMVYGNSDVYSGFLPAQMYHSFGYTSYASGRANQTVGEAVDLLKETLKTQKPGVVLLETDCFFTNERRVNLDAGNLFSAPFLYHSRWKELGKKDFITRPDRREMRDIHRGFLPSNLVYPSDNYGNYMKEKGRKAAEISLNNQKEIEAFVEICRKADIEVVFLELPSPSSWNYRKHLAVALLAKQHGVPFLDLNLPQKDYKVNLAEDFRDYGNHMNTAGADRATACISRFLEEHYEGVLWDQRKDTIGKDWEETVKRYEALRK